MSSKFYALSTSSIALLGISLAILSGFTCASAFADEPTPALPALRETIAVPVAVEPAATDLDKSKGQQWHRATMKLDGSMCPACLMALEEKLRKFDGVKFVKIARPGHSAAPTTSGAPAAPGSVPDAKATTAPTQPVPADEKPGAHKASVVIIYDANAVKFEHFAEQMKADLYHPEDIKNLPYGESTI